MILHAWINLEFITFLELIYILIEHLKMNKNSYVMKKQEIYFMGKWRKK